MLKRFVKAAIASGVCAAVALLGFGVQPASAGAVTAAGMVTSQTSQCLWSVTTFDPVTGGLLCVGWYNYGATFARQEMVDSVNESDAAVSEALFVCDYAIAYYGTVDGALVCGTLVVPSYSVYIATTLAL